MKKISNEFYQEEPTIMIFWVIFEDRASKLEKICQSISILAIRRNGHQETVSAS